MNHKIKKFLEWSIVISAVPLIAINLLGGIVSFIWLAILGEWSVIIVGALYVFFGFWLVSLLLIPGMIFILPIEYFSRKKNVVGLAVLGFINLFYVYAVIAYTSYMIYSGFTGNLTSMHLFPLLIWSYSVAISPWNYMASKEDKSETGFNGTLNALYFAEIGLILASILIVCGVNLINSFIIFSLFMIIPLAMATYVVVIYTRQEKEDALDNALKVDKEKTSICSKCGHENIDQANFCKSCGEKLE